MLGVIGLVTASIWGTVMHVRENVRCSQAAQEISTVVNNVRALYQGQASLGSTSTDITYPLLQKGAIPLDMHRPGTQYADHPWGGLSGSGSFAVSSATDNQQFTIRLNNLSKKSCIVMASKMGSLTGVSGMNSVTINGTEITSLPVGVAVAVTRCNSATGNIITYRFQLRQPT